MSMLELGDIHVAARFLKNQGRFTLIAVLTLALGIGAITIIFGLINSSLFARLPYADSEQLIAIVGHSLGDTSEDPRISYPDFLDLRAGTRSLEPMAVYSNAAITLTGEGEPERITGSMVSSDCFSALGVQPVLGRTFSDADQDPHLVVLGYDLWREAFGANAQVVGRVIHLNETLYTVIGVMPAAFHLPLRQDQLWVPLKPNPALAQARSSQWLFAIGRKRLGVRESQVEAEMGLVSDRLERGFPATNRGRRFQAVGLRKMIVRQIRPALLLAFAAGTLLLVVCCANVGNLLLARGSTRDTEMATRAALGATRSQLIRQLMTEGVLLSLLAGLAGLVLAAIGVRLSDSFLPSLLRFRVTSSDILSMLLFCMCCSVVTVLLFGLVPALITTQTSVLAPLSRGGHLVSADRSNRSVWNLLLAVQIAVSFTVSIGATLVTASLVRVINLDPGFQASNLLTAQLSLPTTRYRPGPSTIRFYLNVLEEMRGTRLLDSAGVISELPNIGSRDEIAVGFPGHRVEDQKDQPRAVLRVVSMNALAVLRVPLVAGRFFEASDTMDSAKVAIVNRSFARRYWHSEDAIGKQVFSDEVCASKDGCQVVGMVGDIRDFSTGLDTSPELYVPLEQNWWGTMSLVVRSTSGPETTLAEMRRAVHAVDSNIALAKVASMDSLISESLSTRRLLAFTLTILALLIMFVSTVGVYSMCAFFVSKRKKELGMRIALGASEWRIKILLFRQAITVLIWGLALGLVLSLAFNRIFTSFLFGISPFDPSSFIIVGLVLCGATLWSSYIPARRAAQLDPAEALRTE